MGTYDAVEALEELNARYIELLNSKEFIQGNRILHQKEKLRSFDIKGILSRYHKYLIERKVVAKLAKSDNRIFVNEGKAVANPPRGVVYTCITKGYDIAKDPLLLGNNLEYICFTDAYDSNCYYWKMIDIPEAAKKCYGGSVNRYCKMHPFDLFPDYSYAIYIDGNVQTISDLTRLYSVASESKTGIAMHLHSRRDCVYKEAEACSLYKRGNVRNIQSLMNRYRQEGFPENFGLLECTIIVVDLKNANAKKIFAEWWNELNICNTGRDQLVFPYILWKNGFAINDVGILGNNEYKNPKFFIYPHS